MTAVGQIEAQSAPREGALVLAGLLVLAAINLMLWHVDYPPLTDWPNHLARHAIQCAADPETGLGRYYEYRFQWVPNLTAELVHLLPVACASLLATQKVLVQVAMTGLLAATVLLHRAVWARWSVWPLMATFVTQHMALAYGFENFVLAMPLVILALALWFAMAGQGAVRRLAVMVPVVTGVYVCHLYAFAFLFGTLVCLEAAEAWRERRGVVLRAVLLALVALGPVLHLATVTGTAGIEHGATEFGGLWRKLTVVLSPFTALGQPFLDPGVLRATSLQLVAMALIWAAAGRREPGVEIAPGTGLALAAMLAVTLAAPYRLSGVALSDIRFPVLLVCLLVAFTDVRLPRRGALLLVAVIAAAAGARTVWLETRWSAHDAEVRELLSAGAVMTPEDRLLVTRAAPPLEVRLHSHSASHLARETGLFLPDVFSGGNALEAREAVAHRDAFQPFPMPVESLIAEARAPYEGDLSELPWHRRYWADWPSFYTHVLVLGASGAPPEDYPELGRVVAKGSFFAIHEVASIPD